MCIHLTAEVSAPATPAKQFLHSSGFEHEKSLLVQLGLWEALGESGGLCRILPLLQVSGVCSAPHTPRTSVATPRTVINSIPGLSQMERRVKEGRTDKEAAVLSFRALQRGRHLRTLWKPASPTHPAWLKLRCQQENLQFRRYSDPVVSVWSGVPMPEPNEASPNKGCWRAWRQRDRWGLHFCQKHRPTRKKPEAREAQGPVPRADPELLQANELLRGLSLALD